MNRWKSQEIPIVLRQLLYFLVLLCGAIATGVAPAWGQEGQNNQAENGIDAIERRIALIESQIVEAASNDEKLVNLRVELDGVSKSLIDFGVSFRPELNRINARLAELGSGPKDGEAPEPDVVTSERKELLARKVTINGLLGDAEDASVRISGAVNRIADYRRAIFANTLLKRTDSTGVFNAETWSLFLSDLDKVQRTVSSRIRFVWNFRKTALFAAVGLSVLLGTLAWFAFRRTFAPLLFPQTEGLRLSYFRRVSLAFWSTLIPSAAVAAGLSITYGLMFYFGIMAGQTMAIFQALLVAIAAFYFIRRLILAIFSPRRPERRLAPFTDRAARHLVLLAVAMTGVHILDFFLSRLAVIFSTPLAVTVAESMLAAMLIGFLLVLIALVKPFTDPRSGVALPWPIYIRVPMLGLAAFVIVAAVSGYIGLARFSAAQIVISGAILATMLIGVQSGRALAQDDAMENSAFGRYLVERYSLNETALFQISLLIRLAIYLLVLFVGMPLIALQWGFRWQDVWSVAYKLFTNIQIGSINISLFAILLGIVLFIAGYIGTRWFQQWLDRGVLVKSKVDAGVRNSIRTITGYFGIGIAGVIAISAAGFDLSNLAIVAGALSLGIGFGLQNIVNNFVSGLILLAERPFKVGDWIVAGTTTGMVKKISVRATEIETFQKQTVILPNSELINNAVGNWTHRNKLGRIDIPVGVAYGSDPRTVHALLQATAEGDPSVLKVPAPVVAFLGFGDSALNFEVRVHVQDVFDGMVIGTRLRFAIHDALSEHGVSIPFPQRDVNLKVDQLETLLEMLERRNKASDAVQTGATGKPAGILDQGEAIRVSSVDAEPEPVAEPPPPATFSRRKRKPGVETA